MSFGVCRAWRTFDAEVREILLLTLLVAGRDGGIEGLGLADPFVGVHTWVSNIRGSVQAEFTLVVVG